MDVWEFYLNSEPDFKFHQNVVYVQLAGIVELSLFVPFSNFEITIIVVQLGERIMFIV